MHARLVGRAGALHVFAERKLDPRHRSRKQKLARGPAILDLHDCVQAADRVRRPVQQIQRGDTARQLAIEIDVSWVQHVFSPDHRSYGERAFVDGVEHRV